MGAEATPRYGVFVVPRGSAQDPQELGWQALRQLARETGKTDLDSAAQHCLDLLAGDIKRPVGRRRAAQRESRNDEVLKMLGHAAAAQPSYALGATHEAAGQVVSIFWSRSKALADHRHLSKDEMRTRVDLLNRAREHFGLPRTAGPAHTGRRPGSAAHRRAVNAQRELAELYERLHRIAVDRDIPAAQADRTVSLALCGDPTARKQLGLMTNDRPHEDAVRYVRDGLGDAAAQQVRSWHELSHE